MNRTISCPPGIGDSIWLISKLLSTNEKFHFQLPDGKPQRGRQIFDMLPSLAIDCKYVPGLSYKIVEARSAHHTTPTWSSIGYDDIYLSCNGWLESGKRIEGFLPDLTMHYRIDWETSQSKPRADLLLEDCAAKKLIGIYTSSYSGSRNWGTWTAIEWTEFVAAFYKKDPAFVFIIIGAIFDNDMSTDIMNRLRARAIPFINTIGEPLPVVTEILKRLLYFVGFPSGLSILNETLAKKTFMFYSNAIKAIIETWAEPSRIVSGDYKGALFCHPKKAIDWIFDSYKLLTKI